MLLLIDTSEVKLVVALGNEQGRLVSIKKNIRKSRLSQILLSEIDLLLRENGVSLENLKGIVVVRGPGRFTSLRVSTSVANGLGYGLGIPVVGIRKFKVKSAKLEVKSSKLKVKSSKFKAPRRASLWGKQNVKFKVEARRSKIYYRNIFKKGLKKLEYTKIGIIIRPFYGGKLHVRVQK